MKKKTVSLLCIISVILVISFSGCSANDDFIQSFAAKFNTLNGDSVPENLPEKLSSYSEWKENTSWLKIAEVDNADIELFANNEVTDKLFLKWNNCFYELDWKYARSLEWEIKLNLHDIDADGTSELTAILCMDGGTNSYKEEIHVLKQNMNYLTEIAFPLEKFEKWITDNTKTDDGSIIFIDTSITPENIEITNKTKLSDSVHLNYVFLDEGLKIKTVTDTEDMRSLAIVTTDFVYSDGKFIVKSYSISEWDN